jgi:hypothetical protein
MDSSSGDDRPWRDLTESELAALHDVEVGAEWLQRAHGHLLAFHHAVGHGMDRFEAAERGLREAGHVGLADELRDDLLPRGVVGDAWSYGLVEAYEEGLLPATRAYSTRVCDELADGERHVAERRQEERRRERASQE